MRTKEVCKYIVMIAALAVAGAARSNAQEHEVKPGPEHALFKEWEGEWTAIIKTGGAESKGTSSTKVALNGLWIFDSFSGEVMGMKFEGRGACSYDTPKKKYVYVWVDSMSTSPMICEGTYDKATKTLKLAGTMPLPDGTSMKITQTTVTKDADTRLFTLKGAGPDGQEMEMIQITYKRQPKKQAAK